MSFEVVDSQFIDTLESSGIIDAYEYVLRRLIADNLPRNQVYEKCARYLLEYQKLVLENNIRAKNAKSFFELANPEEEQKKQIKAKEIILTNPITLKSRLLFEQEENKPPQKIFETNIDELMKNKLNLLSKNALNEQIRSNLKGYGSYAAFVENENEKLRNYDYKINAKFTNFQFTPFEEIEKENYDKDIINNLNINDINNNGNPNSNAEFSVPQGKERMKTGPSRKNTNKSKESQSETVSSKSVTSSQKARIKKVSDEIVNDLMKK